MRNSLLIIIGLAITTNTPTPLPLSYPSYFGNRIYIPADNPVTVEGVALGRRLFYETKLSANNRISCATCHRQEYAFTDGKPFSTGVDGTLTKRNSMTLANLVWVRNFFWDGRADGLEEQAATPLTDEHEMGQALCKSAEKLQAAKPYPALFKSAFGSSHITAEGIINAITQFERTLISCNSRYDQYLQEKYQPTPSELNGMTLFFANPNPEKQVRGAACGHCHGGPKTFNELFHNNGLDSMPGDAGREGITKQPTDKGRFRVVTLRNIALTAPYMHDGRFNTLEEVVDHYSDHVQSSRTLSIFLQDNSNTTHGKQLQLTAQEKKDLIAFLHMLTDSSFITDKRFSDPFKNK
ncbi:cytochrome-c peroxidase [Niastella yeongjuensis]|uniref:Cytochrome-c peroxidase n=1 Tax=Niastella yeongjuensis TaxID=354355 RepID=A0A1V9E3N5_9BACT|nr:cytochrome c peroxidase [Niastella yeongjuensis]OQP40706.1 cytochrome-c peroxidase [Niastella yeongjuensis]SEP04089.1 cytochrome c peroxidase [Niastella yeongjuensis]